MNPGRPDRRKVQLAVGGTLLLLIAMAGLFAPFLAPRDPLAPNLQDRLSAPSRTYPFGTDQLGRCVLSRVLYGARISLTGAIAASGLSLVIGAAVGIAAAVGGRWLAAAVTSLIDMALALPGLILAVVFGGVFGGSIQGLVAGLAMAAWPWWARLIRGLTMSAREKEFVLAGRVAGVNGVRMVRHYILPQMKNPVLAAAALKTGWIILAFSGLSYLGLGPPPPAPEWGRMLQEAAIYMSRAPWLMLAPGAAVTLTVLGLNLTAEGLNEERYA
jgi:ABC-type dipeptide/oligopeptide/nickel transport system permease subunit